jgi:hypothetical protein
MPLGGAKMLDLVSFDDAYAALSDVRVPHLLLGNGFSIAVRPNIFSYNSLYENADFSRLPEVIKIFEFLETTDFEKVIQYLLTAARTLKIYAPQETSLYNKILSDVEQVKKSLVSTIAKHHPERPYELSPDQYVSARRFLFKFNHKFTLNYDVLLYWSLMQDDIDDLDLEPDDGFRNPDDASASYVSWQQGNKATVNYLHGALHLFDQGSDIIKYT